MIKHIVMIKLKSFPKEEDKDKNALKLKEELEGLKEIIKEINFFEVGINFSPSASAYDLVIISEFKNNDALDKYRTNPEHQKVLEFLRSISSKTIVVDYEV